LRKGRIANGRFTGITDRRAAIVTPARIKESASASEVFVTARPTAGLAPDEAAREVFAAVAEILRRRDARILHERVFAVDSALGSILPARTAAYGDLDDGGPAVLLAVPEGPVGALAGVQVHAVRAACRPQVIHTARGPCGRTVNAGNFEYVALSSLMAPEAGIAPAQARAMFEQAEAVLAQVGGTMRSVARTWLWLGDILSWYAEFNRVRTGFFTEKGLLDGDPRHSRLPASTGIGVRPAGKAACALEAVAMIGREESIECLAAAGKQNCAYKYGSAFSRVARAPTPGGKTVYVSGTAAIDETGRTRHIGDPGAQIRMTIENVRACLRDAQCTDTDVVQAIAYSKTPQVEDIFLREWADLGWPCVSVQSDICREDLLFEVEATACAGARAI
jgi:enamine deaminase RidA (YjgF/YER057c/UK114 family)